MGEIEQRLDDQHADGRGKQPDGLAAEKTAVARLQLARGWNLRVPVEHAFVDLRDAVGYVGIVDEPGRVENDAQIGVRREVREEARQID